MSNPDINAELCDSVVTVCNKMVKNMKMILDQLEYWEDECGLEFPKPYQNLRKNLTNTLNAHQVEEKKA